LAAPTLRGLATLRLSDRPRLEFEARRVHLSLQFGALCLESDRLEVVKDDIALFAEPSGGPHVQVEVANARVNWVLSGSWMDGGPRVSSAGTAVVMGEVSLRLNERLALVDVQEPLRKQIAEHLVGLLQRLVEGRLTQRLQEVFQAEDFVG